MTTSSSISVSSPAPANNVYRVCLIGSGGLGTIASLVLVKSGQAHVTVVLRSKYKYITEHGWDIDSIDHGKIQGWRPHRIVASVHDAAVQGTEKVEFDYVVVCTKHLPGRHSVAAMIAPVMTPGRTTVVLIQNGLGIEDEIVTAWPSNTVMSGVSHIGSGVEEPNRVVQVGRDVSKVGVHYELSSVSTCSSSSSKPASEAACAAKTDADAAKSEKRIKSRAKAEAYVAMYNAGGAHKCELVDDIETARWVKLVWNGTFNTICALTRSSVGELQRSKGREALLVPMMWEIWRIAAASGHPLPESLVKHEAYRLPDDCAYRPSMMLDLQNGRPLELDVILGNPIKVARRLGVPTPIMDVVYNLLLVESFKMEQRAH
ncbi:hypothetical protein SEPCBS119000_002970 [Sporothrix epigloea]|uniref:2-dehydropantoate 2-reductase n=1 Tax=Sporothrix epigloea TaxID=1892477 RepID=A0ABP0DNA7_9PEZI